jgi:N-acetylglucosaminyl-diphospho-decaprenol L-rhamnosyltransferase
MRPHSPEAPVAVAVVSWNTRELLERCLASLRADSESGLADVWVVDNGSTDGSAEMVEEAFPWVTLVRAPENLGYGRAANLVAERTSSAWVAPANSDIELRPGALELLLRTGEATPEAGCVAPRLILPDGSTQSSVQPFPSIRGSLRAAAGGAPPTVRAGAEAARTGRPVRVDWATGAFVLVPRGAWDAVGGFDPRHWMYAEDLDLAWRLARAGYPSWYDPRAQVLHHLSIAAAHAFGDEEARAVRWMAANQRWLKRRRGSAYAAAYSATHLMLASLRLARGSLGTALGRPGARDRRERALRSVRRQLRARRAARADERAS